MTNQPAAQSSHAPAVLRGMELLNHQCWNKGTAFSEEERSQLGLHGLLPPYVETLGQQLVRAYEAYQRKDDDLERHIYLRALQDTNEVLFYRLLLEHVRRNEERQAIRLVVPKKVVFNQRAGRRQKIPRLDRANAAADQPLFSLGDEVLEANTSAFPSNPPACVGR